MIKNQAPRTIPPGQWLERSPLLMWLTVALGGAYLVRYFMQAGAPLTAVATRVQDSRFSICSAEPSATAGSDACA